MSRRGFLKKAAEFTAGAALVGAGVTGAEAQEAKSETQESNILPTVQIAELTRAAVLKLRREGETVIRHDKIAELGKRIFNGKDLAVGEREFPTENSIAATPLQQEAHRAYTEFTSWLEDYFGATETAMRARWSRQNLASVVEEARSKKELALIIPTSIAEPLEDNELRNAEKTRAVALKLARANDALLSEKIK